ncbi:MAG TPA: hypothetical protein VEK85_04645 [Gemmatimonadales bacterium]|nr:hypothetical protein [Gemmatimonadales bacterium]
MTTRNTCLAALVAAGLGVGCAGHTHYDPFLVPQNRIYGSVKTIALTPLTQPDELGSADPKRGKFDSLIAAELRGAGFTVVPPEESAAIWKRVTDSLGGLFSAATGERDTVKLNVARSVAMAELRARFQADAWLHARIVFASAKFDQGDARWDGAKQTYQSFGKKFLTALFGGGTYGKTAALSVWVDLEDLRGKDLYINEGGLQLYMVPSGHDWVRIPSGELYADSARNANAVRLALAPLVTRAVSAKSQ